MSHAGSGKRPESLDDRIARWRAELGRRGVSTAEGEALERRLRDAVAGLAQAGLTLDEAYLVALRRTGQTGALAREVALERSGEASGAEAPGWSRAGRFEAAWALTMAVAAAVAFKLPELLGAGSFVENAEFYARNAGLFALTPLAVYFAWKRALRVRQCIPPAGAFLAAAVFANIYPFAEGAATGLLTAIHLPIALWLAVGFTYVGGRWRSAERRMDFIRFSGEWFVHYVLIALGGGVFTGLTIGMFASIGVDVEVLLTTWVLPCGAMGAVVVSAWLVETRPGVVENVAPVLARVFTPLFALALVALLATMAWLGVGVDFDRDLLIGFDLILVVVFGLLLYSLSARDPASAPGLFDGFRLLLLVSMVAVDAVALAAIAARITEFGFTANRTAALGENLILLVNLARAAWLDGRLFQKRAAFPDLERWQAGYLPVFGAWAGLVVVAFPPLFGYR